MTNENILNYNVTGRQSFAEFITLLRNDLISSPEKWENNTLERFLAALAAYSADIQGYYYNMGQNVNADEASWSIFADMLKGATMYE